MKLHFDWITKIIYGHFARLNAKGELKEDKNMVD